MALLFVLPTYVLVKTPICSAITMSTFYNSALDKGYKMECKTNKVQELAIEQNVVFTEDYAGYLLMYSL